MSSNDKISDETDSNCPTLKYGDADVSSKRRKRFWDFLPDYSSFETTALVDSELNSTLCHVVMGADSGSGDDAFTNQDCKGGLVGETPTTPQDTTTNTTMLCAKTENLISKQPSDTSRGFDNTFSILEAQLEAKLLPKRLQLRRISEESVSTTITPAADETDVAEDASLSPHLFELELEAIARIRGLMSQPSKSQPPPAGLSDAIPASPLNELLYGFAPAGLHNNACCSRPDLKCGETTLEESGEYPEFVYHLARGKDGQKYVKVVRSLLLDKVLCGNRVSQMTRAYDDTEAITRLLEEKEKDLELTVQIGKELLTQNNRLENRIAELEADLKSSNEDRSQLLHELHQKTQLISILTNDVDDSENETPTMSKSITLDLLQRKISTLQDENKSLKTEASHLVRQADEVEEQERKLMEDITTQLNSTNCQFEGLSLELERHREENRLQHEQIVNLTARLAEAEMRLHQLTQENDEQGSLLGITKENQNLLAIELTEFKTRYQEVLALLHESQELLRKQRKKVQPHARSSLIPGLGFTQPDSLHSELMESSMYSENSLDSGISTDRMSGLMMSHVPGGGGVIPPYKKIFDTVRCAGKTGHYSDGMTHLGAMSMSSSSVPRMSAMPYMATGMGNPAGSYHRPSSVYSGSSYPSYDSSSLGVKTMSCESLASQSDDGYPSAPSGVPGAPGAKDLEAALKRLTPAEVLARRAMLSYAPIGTYTYDDNPPVLPLGIRTPDSIMSTGSSHMSASNHWRLPEKLQIVKPMEGSQTLHHWSRLATPTLSGLLDERPGVTIRGGRGLDDLGMQMYSLSDVEEDVDDYPGKQYLQSECIYTYTTSTVMHPDDGIVHDLTFLSQSQLSSRMASNSTSRQPSCPATPRAGLSRRNSCSTFSVNTGLASMLNERGIKAVTPSALNTPAGPNFTPTVTPCNSPEGSPRSRSPEPMFGILSSGADLIRRKLLGEIERPTRSQRQQQKIMLSRLEKRALRSLRLVEQVESIGLENIIATQPSPISQRNSGIASRSASPMSQLTSLRGLHAANHGMVDDIHFNRDQIKGVLNKGLSCSSSSISSMDSYDFGDNNMIINNVSVTADYHMDEDIVPSEAAASVQSTNSLAKSEATSNVRVRQMQRQKSRRNLKNGLGGQRSDLGTVAGRVRPDLGMVGSRPSTSSQRKKDATAESASAASTSQQQSMTQAFVGSISSLLFGRKGGWL